MSYFLEVWSNVECADGAERLAFIPRFEAGTQSLSLSKDETLTVVAPRYNVDGTEFPWVSLATIRAVIRVENDVTGDVWEWRISGVQDQRDQKHGSLVTITGAPILHDLRSFIVEHPVTSGLTYRNLGFISLAPQQAIDTFIIGNAKCPSWIVRGTITPTDGVDMSWECYSGLEFVWDLETRLKGYELRLRRNGSTDYRLDIVATGSGTTGPFVEFGRNLLTLIRRVSMDNFATVILPRGGMPSGAIEFGGIEDNVWRITAKTGSGPHVLTLADPAGGAGPVGFADQLNGLYLESASATTREEVTDSDESAQTVTVADGSDFAVGDYVRIVADSDGSLLSTLPHPDSVDAYGEVIGTANFPDQRAARNYYPSGALHQSNGWGNVEWQCHGALADGLHSSTTTVNLKGMPPGLVIPTNTRIEKDGLSGFNLAKYVTVGDTVDGSGLATITIDTAISWDDEDELFLLIWESVDGVLDDWPTLGGSEAPSIVSSNDSGNGMDLSMVAIPVKRNETAFPAGADASGTFNGAFTASNGYADVSDLEPDTYFSPALQVFFYDDGDVLRGPYALHAGFLTDPSGDARIYFAAGVGNDSVDGNVIYFVDDLTDVSALGVKIGDYTLLGPYCYATNYLEFAGVPVRYVPGKSTLYFGCGFSIMGYGYTWDITGNYLQPKAVLSYRQLGSSDSYDTATAYADGSPYSNTNYVALSHDFSGSVVLDEDKEVFCRVYPYRISATGKFFVSAMSLQAFRYFSLWLGPDPDPAITPGSGANVLWQKGNEVLSEISTPETRYTLTVQDLAHAAGFDPAVEKPVIGADYPVYDKILGARVNVRLMGIDYDLANPLQSKLHMERTVRLATKRLMNPRYTVRRPEAGQSTELTGPEVRPAVREDGAYRSQGVADSSGGVVTPTEYEA